MYRPALKILTLVLVLCVAACSDDQTVDTLASPTAESGTLVVRLASPFANDGAISLELRGEGITNVQGVQGTQIYTTEATGMVKVALMGVGLAGDVVTFDVPDVGAAANYVASLVEVADEGNEVRRDLSGYTLTVARRN